MRNRRKSENRKWIVVEKNLRNVNVTVNIAGQNIKQVDHTQFLGVYIDEKLCCKFHINYFSMKVSKIARIT